MPVRALCVLFCWFVCAAASAQASVVNDSVTVVCRYPSDYELAVTLGRLIARPVQTIPLDASAPQPAGDVRVGEWVTIDREAATVTVYSTAHKTTLSRVLDAEVMTSSTYAVALATAELLEFTGAGRTHPASLRAPVSVASSPQVGLGVDLELQSQPGFELSFVRPALQLELAWGRERAGGFWSLGVRAAGPGVRSLQVAAAAAPGASARLAALSADAAVQLTFGHALGRLALLTQLAAGISYLQLEALDTAGRTLGRDTQLSPLLAAGVGFRYSLWFGFALTVRAEAQWAGPAALYRIAQEPVLETGVLRVGLLAGVLWEAALARTP